VLKPASHVSCAPPSTRSGTDLKIRRPSDYDERTAAKPGVIPTLDVGKLGIISTQVPDTGQ